MFRERILISLNPIVCGFNISSFKRRFANDQGVNDDTEGPNVDFIGVTSATFQHFRSDIIRRTTNSPFLLSIKVQFCCEAKVSKFDLHFVVNKEVAQLQIPMNNPMLM